MNVALRLECVDRNAYINLCNAAQMVALRLECVDRNGEASLLLQYVQVALRLECVDRNYYCCLNVYLLLCRTPFGVRG